MQFTVCGLLPGTLGSLGNNECYLAPWTGAKQVRKMRTFYESWKEFSKCKSSIPHSGSNWHLEPNNWLSIARDSPCWSLVFTVQLDPETHVVSSCGLGSICVSVFPAPSTAPGTMCTLSTYWLDKGAMRLMFWVQNCNREIKRLLLLGRKVMTNLVYWKAQTLLCQQRSV